MIKRKPVKTNMELAIGAVEYAMSEVQRLEPNDQRDDAMYHLRRAREALGSLADTQLMAVLPFLILMLSQNSKVKRWVSQKTSGSSPLAGPPDNQAGTPP